MKYSFKLHPEFDNPERIFARPAVVVAQENEEPWLKTSPTMARIIGIADSFDAAAELVRQDVERISEMARMDTPCRPKLLTEIYELHFWSEDQKQYICVGHEVSVDWPDCYRLTGDALPGERLELTSDLLRKR